jgi:formate--tetrahydrofolate ligase
MKELPLVAAELGLAPQHLLFYGRDKAKVALAALTGRPARGRLILVSALTPTPAGEGKTTVSIGLAQGLKKIGRSAALALREPSMGPVFGRKGGATGGGRSSLTPAQDINLHFTGDFHAITAANNLLAAVLDNRLHFKTVRLAPADVLWKRVLDVNERALRAITTSRGSPTERETGFNITAASEIMAILCLAESLADLRVRLNRIVLGFTPEGDPVFAEELKATGALLAVLRDALMPNLVQSVEGVPAFVHGGPFANIAHGCNSVLATRLALAHADFAVTEAGFAFDLGGEKFLDIKCRQSGLAPAAIVLVATVRALKHHGGTAPADLVRPDVAAVSCGLDNLAAHLASATRFGRPVIVAINQFGTDVPEELAAVQDFCRAQGVPCAVADVFGQGGDGAVELARTLVGALPASTPPVPFLYRDDEPVEQKLHNIVTRMYGADGVVLTPEAQAKLALFTKGGFQRLPICMAKTQDSLTDDPKKPGRPRGFTITVRDFEIANGAGYLVALTGQMMRMPALPRIPAAERIDVTDDGTITGM